MKKFKLGGSVLLLLSLALYIAGAALIKNADVSLLNHVRQQEYTYTDGDGEEHVGVSLLDVKGLGRVFTYMDIYLLAIPMLFISPVLHRIIFGNSGRELKFMVFANSIIGLLLLFLTSKGDVLSTILYWASILAPTFSKELWQEGK